MEPKPRSKVFVSLSKHLRTEAMLKYLAAQNVADALDKLYWKLPESKGKDNLEKACAEVEKANLTTAGERGFV